jgi:hypothetical protein
MELRTGWLWLDHLIHLTKIMYYEPYMGKAISTLFTKAGLICTGYRGDMYDPL